MILTALSNLRRKPSFAIPSIKVRRRSSKKRFQKVFEDPKLRNLVGAHRCTTEALKEYLEAVKVYLRKARDGERILDEALRRFKNDETISNVEEIQNYLRCNKSYFTDLITKDWLRMRENCSKHLRNLKKVHESMDSLCSLLSVGFFPCLHLRKSDVIFRRLVNLGIDHESLFDYYFALVVTFGDMEFCMRSISSIIEVGHVEELEGQFKNLKPTIECVECWMKDFDKNLEKCRFKLHQTIMEFVSDV